MLTRPCDQTLPRELDQTTGTTICDGQFDAIPSIKRRHQPIGIPKQPLLDVLAGLIITWAEPTELICQVFQDCRRLYEDPAIMFDHRHLTPAG